MKKESFIDFWHRLIRWPGWTAWLHWSGWKKIGSWTGWHMVLFLHPLVVLLLTVFSALGLGWVFLNGQENNPVAYLIYPLSAYALTVLLATVIKNAPKAKKFPRKESSHGAFGVGIYVDQFINFFYGIFKIVTGVLQGSAWIGSDGIYNLVQGLIQLYQILRHKQNTDLKGQWKSYRQCGFMMIVLHMTMTGLIFQMVHLGRHQDSSEIMIIATAAFTFYKLIHNFIRVAKDRKHQNPVDSAVYYLKFSQALYNLFVLQVGLLWVFGGTEFAYQKLMNSLTGGAVCLLVCGMGFYMLWRSKRDLRKLEETENG